jgi:hypothetical protein
MAKALRNNQAFAVVTATSVETKAARRVLPDLTVIEAGVALRNYRGAFDRAVISCGVAGGLHHHLHTGTVVIPREVLRPDGTTLHCDPVLTEGLLAAARARGVAIVDDPLVTTTTLITGDERRAWSERGYAGVDMETGLLEAPAVAAVRVVLDTPLRELSEEWLHPVRALMNPRLWPEAMWLARNAPRCAAIAAEIIRDAFPPQSRRSGG